MERQDRSDAYWRTEISRVTPTEVVIRGYSLEDLVGQLPFTAAVHLLVRGRIPTPQETRVLDAVLTAVLDYSLQKPGTVAARYVVSANPSMVAGLAAATLAVGQHTLATEDTARFVQETHRAYLASGMGLQEFAEQVVAERAALKARIPGLGHPVFKKVDPRAQKLKDVVVGAGLWSEACELYEAVHRAFTARPGKSEIPVNDVGMMAVSMAALGFTPEESTGLAVISTLPGVVAHVSEELRTARPIRVVPEGTAEYDVDEAGDFAADWTAAGW